MIEVKVRAIDGYTYHVQQFGAREGARVLVRLGKLLGHAVGSAVSEGSAVDWSVAAKVLGGLAESLTETDFDWLCDSLIKHTRISGGKFAAREVALSEVGVFDELFAGHYERLVKWLVFALEANYADFLAEIGPIRLGVQASAEPAKPSA